MTKWLLLAVLFGVSACDANLQGFKDVRFGLGQHDIEALGFTCRSNGECLPNRPATDPITPEEIVAGNATRGASHFSRCSSCHNINEGGGNGIGPNLWGVLGRSVADESVGFAYSDAMKRKGGKWDAASLDQLLADPKSFVPDSKMTMESISEPRTRADIIAYINQQRPNPTAPVLAAGSEQGVKRKVPEYTLFGKTADVRPNLKNGNVVSIDVSVALSADDIIHLLTGEYGAPKSYEHDGLLGGRYKVTYWIVGNTGALAVGQTLSDNALVRRAGGELREIGMDRHEYSQHHSTVHYMDSEGVADLLKKSEGNSVVPDDV